MASGGTKLADWLGTLSRYLYVADLVEHRNVVELGCGTGVGCEFLANHGARSVLGIERDRESVSEARLRRALINVEYRVGDYDALELEDASVGLVLAHGAEALRRQSVALEIRRVLSNDGYLVWSAPSADRPGTSGGVSFHEFGDRLGELFGVHRMIAVQPLVGMSLAEYAESEPDVELDTSLARLGAEPDPVSDYVAVFGPERTESRPYTVVQLPGVEGLRLTASALGIGASDADRLRDELARERRERHRAESLASDLKMRVAELERGFGDLTRGTSDERAMSVEGDLAASLERAPQVSQAVASASEAVAAALEAHHAEVGRLEAELAELREYVAELEDAVAEGRERLHNSETDLAIERGRVETMRAQLGDWRDRTARAEGQALGLALQLEGMATADDAALAQGTDPGLALEQLNQAEVLLREQAELIGEMEAGLREMGKRAAKPTEKGRAGEQQHQLSELAAQLGGREAEVVLLTVGLRSLRDRLAKTADELEAAIQGDDTERWREVAISAVARLRGFAAS